MATEVHPGSEQSLTTLVSGIVADFQDLLTQQMQLTRQEVEKDLRKAKEAASVLFLGAAICYLGAFLTCVGLALLIHWAGSPQGSDPATIPLWGCLALVGLPLGIGGGIVAGIGRQQFESVHPLEASAKAIKENVEWKTNPT